MVVVVVAHGALYQAVEFASSALTTAGDANECTTILVGIHAPWRSHQYPNLDRPEIVDPGATWRAESR